MIGVAGSSPGVGVTHFSIMIASYLSGVLGKRTALLEENKSGDFARIFEILSERSVLKQEKGSCSVLEISFMKEAGPETFSDLANSEFDTVVIDFGHDFEAVRTKFQLCQRKFLVGSLAEWKIHSFFEAGRREKTLRRKMGVFYQLREQRIYEGAFKISGHRGQADSKHGGCIYGVRGGYRFLWGISGILKKGRQNRHNISRY